MDKVDVVVIGAGVVGLACARALALTGREVVVLESESAYGQGVSSRSSEVIHGGMYYAAGSLKARLCVEGKQRLYAYCAERGVGHRRCGKLIVATGPGDGAKLDTIAARAKVNGVHDLERLSAAEAIALEPAVACHGALLSPSTGIVDSHQLMTALLGDAENAGAVLALRSPFVGARREGAHWRIATGGDEPFEIGAGWIVNAAGLGAQAAAHAMEGFPSAAIPPLWKAKGRYFALPSKAPFTRLIYPTPIDGGLGVHLTLDLGGQARFGPDVQWLAPDAPFDYEVDPALRSAFEADVRRYWPALPEGALQPAYAGVRPKLDGPGTTPDFMITGPAEHGSAGVMQLFGIESPGLTSSLAIAEFVLDRVRGAEAK